MIMSTKSKSRKKAPAPPKRTSSFRDHPVGGAKGVNVPEAVLEDNHSIASDNHDRTVIKYLDSMDKDCRFAHSMSASPSPSDERLSFTAPRQQPRHADHPFKSCSSSEDILSQHGGGGGGGTAPHSQSGSREKMTDVDSSGRSRSALDDGARSGRGDDSGRASRSNSQELLGSSHHTPCDPDLPLPPPPSPLQKTPIMGTKRHDDGGASFPPLSSMSTVGKLDVTNVKKSISRYGTIPKDARIGAYLASLEPNAQNMNQLDSPNGRHDDPSPHCSPVPGKKTSDYHQTSSDANQQQQQLQQQQAPSSVDEVPNIKPSSVLRTAMHLQAVGQNKYNIPAGSGHTTPHTPNSSDGKRTPLSPPPELKAKPEPPPAARRVLTAPSSDKAQQSRGGLVRRSSLDDLDERHLVNETPVRSGTIHKFPSRHPSSSSDENLLDVSSTTMPLHKEDNKKGKKLLGGYGSERKTKSKFMKAQSLDCTPEQDQQQQQQMKPVHKFLDKKMIVPSQSEVMEKFRAMSAGTTSQDSVSPYHSSHTTQRIGSPLGIKQGISSLKLTGAKSALTPGSAGNSIANSCNTTPVGSIKLKSTSQKMEPVSQYHTSQQDETASAEVTKAMIESLLKDLMTSTKSLGTVANKTSLTFMQLSDKVQGFHGKCVMYVDSLPPSVKFHCRELLSKLENLAEGLKTCSGANYRENDKLLKDLDAVIHDLASIINK